MFDEEQDNAQSLDERKKNKKRRIQLVNLVFWREYVKFSIHSRFK